MDQSETLRDQDEDISADVEEVRSPWWPNNHDQSCVFDILSNVYYVHTEVEGACSFPASIGNIFHCDFQFFCGENVISLGFGLIDTGMHV